MQQILRIVDVGARRIAYKLRGAARITAGTGAKEWSCGSQRFKV
jgi:hypothetical protein